MFKKLLALLTLLSFTWILTVAQDSVPNAIPGEVYYAPFNITITLDGDIADWEGVPRVLLSGGGHSVVFAAAADESFIYVLGDVTDPNIISGEHGENYWNEDSIEFYFNGTGDFTRRSYAPGIAQVTVPALNKDLPPEEAIISGIQGNSVGAQVFVTETAEGYRVEMAVPLKNDVWDITPAHGGIIGFQVHLNATSSGSRDTKLIWSNADTNDQSYQNPSVFGYLMFFDLNETEIPELPEIVAENQVELPPVPDQALYRNGRFSPEARIIDLMSRMSLAEKIAQMTLIEVGSISPEDVNALAIGGVLSGGGGYPRVGNTVENWAQMVNSYVEASLDTRLGIPIIYGVDAVHGHNNVYGATIFPHNIGLGATRNAALVEQICRATALEMIATGIYWDYAPVVAVPQDIRWGRTYEAYAEDTELVTELAMACLNGLQGESLTDPFTVLGTPKHYVGDGGAVWGTSTTDNYMIDQGVTDVDEATLRAVHLPPYAAAIENNAQSIMISYSSWGGMKMHAQAYLINDVLKGELGFEGFVVSDWAGVDQISPNYYEAVVTSINAGVDMVMVPYDPIRFMETLTDAVNNGDVPVERIDDAVRRILLVKFELGLFENALANTDLMTMVGSDEHRQLARQAVAESQVLLKNDDDLLPLSPEIDRVFVAGVAADDIGIQSGGWTIEWQGGTGDITPGTTILEGIQAVVSDNTEVVYAPDGDFGDETASVGIVVVGERPYAEGRGDDADLELSASDIETIAAMQEAVDQVIVVIISGRPLMITDYIDDWDAVVAAWLPGTEGAGVADVLFGIQPFTGKLPVTWFASVDQLPLGSSDEAPLFPFGWGLTTGE
ncbi:MAG: beta-glucosidase [Chloroflexi bacterium]|nr:MAG: beta-glucosidase [Chloroflexota bacterium]